jgi:hypothetical protein
LAIFGVLEPARNEYLPEQIPQGDVAASLQGKIDPSLDKLFLPSSHGGIIPNQVSFSDAGTKWSKQPLETRELCEELLAWQCMCCDEVTGHKICEDQPGTGELDE